MITIKEILASVISEKAASALPPAQHWPHVAKVAIDSRVVQTGDLFVALPGEFADGHSFVADALRRGALGALVRRAWVRQHQAAFEQQVVLVTDPATVAHVRADLPILFAVDDPLAALQRLSAQHRRRMPAQVIGITGSVGKTSVKDVTAAILRQRYRTVASDKSYNNEIGVPLTLLQLRAEHEMAVIEMGTYGIGEIALLCRLAQPRYGVVTNVGVSHLERMKTPETIAQAKGELVEALPTDGAAILNLDDPRVRAMAERTSARTFFYGRDPGADLWVDEIESHGLQGVSFTVHYGAETYRFRTALLGRHVVYIALPALAVGLLAGLDWDALAAGLRDVGVRGRINVVRGVNGATILDDSYNASPASCQAALDLLAEVPGRRTAIFGDMAELGPVEQEGHRAVGKAAAAVVDRLIVVGNKARWIAEAAQQEPNAPEIMVAYSNSAAAQLVRSWVGPKDVVLVKGARAAYTEQIVDALRDAKDGQ